MKQKFDLFGVLEFLDLRSLQVREVFLDEPELLKELDRNAGWLLPQWMTGAYKDQDHAALISRFNEIANPGWYSLQKHPELQLKLLALCGLGRKVKHKFTKLRSNPTMDKLTELLLQVYPDIRQEEVELWVRQNDRDDLIELATRLGYQTEEQEALLKAYDGVKDS